MQRYIRIDRNIGNNAEVCQLQLTMSNTSHGVMPLADLAKSSKKVNVEVAMISNKQFLNFRPQERHENDLAGFVFMFIFWIVSSSLLVLVAMTILVVSKLLPMEVPLMLICVVTVVPVLLLKVPLNGMK